jgi:hypothetical protein
LLIGREGTMDATKSLIDHLIFKGGSLPPIRAALYEYVMAAGGLYVRGRREGMEAVVPVTAAPVPGLATLEPGIALAYPRVPLPLMTEMLALSAQAGAVGLERLFYLAWESDRWILLHPAQRQNSDEVEPLDYQPGSEFSRAFIEVHSHNRWPARFSAKDNRAERDFRLYAVIGRIDSAPEIRLRAGLYGNFLEIPSNQVFEMPADLRDAAEVCTR